MQVEIQTIDDLYYKYWTKIMVICCALGGIFILGTGVQIYFLWAILHAIKK